MLKALGIVLYLVARFAAKHGEKAPITLWGWIKLPTLSQATSGRFRTKKPKLKEIIRRFEKSIYVSIALFSAIPRMAFLFAICLHLALAFSVLCVYTVI